MEVLRDAGAEGLVVIGGGGSLSGGLALDKLGLPTVGVPATIDNDIPGTDLSIGVDTALNTATTVIDRIKEIATAHRRAIVVEVLGRDLDFLGVMSAIAGGADAVMVPGVRNATGGAVGAPERVLRQGQAALHGGSGGGGIPIGRRIPRLRERRWRLLQSGPHSARAHPVRWELDLFQPRARRRRFGEDGGPLRGRDLPHPTRRGRGRAASARPGSLQTGRRSISATGVRLGIHAPARMWQGR